MHDQILVNDDRIKAVRIWSSSHVLEWSSLSNDDVGSDGALNDDDIDAATAAAGAPHVARRPPHPHGRARAGDLLLVHGDRDAAADRVVRIPRWRLDLGRSQPHGSATGSRSGSGCSWRSALSLLSMREPLAEIGTGVPFYPGSVPENLTLIEVDRAVELEQAGDRIKERTASLQHKLEASEAARLRAEGRLQQALAALAQPGARSVMPVPQPTPVVTDVVKIPEPSVVASPESDATTAAPAKPAPAPRGRSLVVPKKQRTPRRAPKRKPAAVPAPKPVPPTPVVQAPQPKPVVRTPEPAPQEPVVETPQPEPAPIVPPPEPAPIVPPPDPIITPEPDPVQVAKVEPSDDGGSPEVVVVVPELQPVGTPAGPESASDLLDRLVEPVPEHGSTEAPRRPSRQAGANRRAQEAGIERASGGGRAAPILSSRVVGTARSGAGTTVSRQVLCDA